MLKMIHTNQPVQIRQIKSNLASSFATKTGTVDLIIMNTTGTKIGEHIIKTTPNETIAQAISKYNPTKHLSIKVNGNDVNINTYKVPTNGTTDVVVLVKAPIIINVYAKENGQGHMLISNPDNIMGNKGGQIIVPTGLLTNNKVASINIDGINYPFKMDGNTIVINTQIAPNPSSKYIVSINLVSKTANKGTEGTHTNPSANTGNKGTEGTHTNPSANTGNKGTEGTHTNPSASTGNKGTEGTHTNPSANTGNKGTEGTHTNPSTSTGNKGTEGTHTNPSANTGNKGTEGTHTNPSANTGNKGTEGTHTNPSANTGNKGTEGTHTNPSTSTGNVSNPKTYVVNEAVYNLTNGDFTMPQVTVSSGAKGTAITNSFNPNIPAGYHLVKVVLNDNNKAVTYTAKEFNKLVLPTKFGKQNIQIEYFIAKDNYKDGVITSKIIDGNTGKILSTFDNADINDYGNSSLIGNMTWHKVVVPKGYKLESVKLYSQGELIKTFTAKEFDAQKMPKTGTNDMSFDYIVVPVAKTTSKDNSGVNKNSNTNSTSKKVAPTNTTKVVITLMNKETHKPIVGAKVILKLTPNGQELIAVTNPSANELVAITNSKGQAIFNNVPTIKGGETYNYTVIKDGKTLSTNSIKVVPGNENVATVSTVAPKAKISETTNTNKNTTPSTSSGSKDANKGSKTDNKKTSDSNKDSKDNNKSVSNGGSNKKTTQTYLSAVDIINIKNGDDLVSYLNSQGTTGEAISWGNIAIPSGYKLENVTIYINGIKSYSIPADQYVESKLPTKFDGKNIEVQFNVAPKTENSTSATNSNKESKNTTTNNITTNKKSKVVNTSNSNATTKKVVDTNNTNNTCNNGGTDNNKNGQTNITNNNTVTVGHNKTTQATAASVSPIVHTTSVTANMTPNVVTTNNNSVSVMSNNAPVSETQTTTLANNIPVKASNSIQLPDTGIANTTKSAKSAGMVALILGVISSLGLFIRRRK